MIGVEHDHWWRRFKSKTDYIKFMEVMRRVGHNAQDNGLVNTINMYAEIDALRNLWAAMETSIHGSEYNDLLRVSIRDSGNFDIVDFTTPRRAGKVLLENALQCEVPEWIMQTVSMLRIADTNSTIDGVGFKLTDRVYYIVDRRENHDAQAN